MSGLTQSPDTQLLSELQGPRRLGQQLATLLAAEIVSGRMAPGQTFPSAEELVSRFGVSRTVARETVQTLALLGLVRVQHGKRTEVLEAEDWNILSPIVQEALRREGHAEVLVRDLYDFRLLVEPQAAYWSAERASERDVGRLRELARRMEELAGGDTPEQMLSADREFHSLLARASGNRVLAAVTRDISEIVTTLWRLSHPEPSDLRQIAAHHRKIAATIERRDPAGAAEAMREHLTFASQADLGEPVE
jgi:GntR family transcriptional regulator, galactonate operon transcriptional repressor